MKKDIAYLGDGVYVRFEGLVYVIFTSNGSEEKNHIYLEPGHIAALNSFCERIREDRR